MNGNITYPSSVYDDNHHGTHVAGILGAKGNNNNGVAGCNWNSKITSLKVFDSYGNGYSSDLILALNYANVHNISIINFSGGWLQNDTKYDSPVEKAIANYSGLFICAAGNENVNIDNYHCYPASLNLSNMITVGASDENNQKCTFSNYGVDSVDLFAPGNNIYSTYNNGSYASLNGTSMATPYVTGVASLIKSIRPEYTPQEIKNLSWIMSINYLA